MIAKRPVEFNNPGRQGQTTQMLSGFPVGEKWIGIRFVWLVDFKGIGKLKNGHHWATANGNQQFSIRLLQGGKPLATC